MEIKKQVSDSIVPIESSKEDWEKRPSFKRILFKALRTFGYAFLIRFVFSLIG
jgi:hypothetical protein